MKQQLEVMTLYDLQKYLRTSYYNAKRIAQEIPHNTVNSRGDMRFLKVDVDNWLRRNQKG